MDTNNAPSDVVALGQHTHTATQLGTQQVFETPNKVVLRDVTSRLPDDRGAAACSEPRGP